MTEVVTPRFVYRFDREAGEWLVSFVGSDVVIARFSTLLQVENWIQAEGDDIFPAEHQ